jgi:predicted MFS family arabinose efflux permease
MTYRDLVRRHGGTVAFGFSLAFLSALGQTFFISLFGPEIRAAFGLSNGGFGAIYSAATLGSGLLMIWVGGVLDRVSTASYGLFALTGLGLAAFGLSLAPGIPFLLLALFCLRFFGQGMLGHAAITSSARLPQAIRGRALSLTLMGFSAAEIMVPILAVSLFSAIGWLATWRLGGTLVLAAACMVAAGSYLYNRRREPEGPATADSRPASAFRRTDLLRDWRFLIFIPSMITPAAINTGYFFHQRLLGDLRGWSVELLALSVSAYALSAIVFNVVTGSLVDRFGATRLCRGHLLPLGAASLLFVGGGSPDEAPLLFALMGITAAANAVIVPAALAEIYGTEHLGTIRALAGSIMVWGSAATPVLFGLLFDTGLPLAALGIACAIYTVVASLLNVPLHRSQVRARLNPALAE